MRDSIRQLSNETQLISAEQRKAEVAAKGAALCQMPRTEKRLKREAVALDFARSASVKATVKELDRKC